MIDSVFEAYVRPSTWDGDDADRRIGLFTTLLRAQDAGRAWIADHPYDLMGGGHWQLVIVEQPLDGGFGCRPAIYGEARREREFISLLEPQAP